MRNPYFITLTYITAVLAGVTLLLFLIGTVPQNLAAAAVAGVTLNAFCWSLLATLVLGGVIWRPAPPQETPATRRQPGDERPQWMIDGKDGPPAPTAPPRYRE
jgi:predicted phage tail protein